MLGRDDAVDPLPALLGGRHRERAFAAEFAHRVGDLGPTVHRRKVAGGNRHRDDFDEVVAQLLEHEQLDGAEVYRLLGKDIP